MTRSKVAMRVIRFLIAAIVAGAIIIAIAVGSFLVSAPPETVARFDPRTPVGQATWARARSGELTWDQLGELLGPSDSAALELLATAKTTPEAVFDPPTRELTTGDTDADVVLKYRFEDRSLKLGVNVTREDLRDDVDIGDMWITDRAVRSRRVQRYVDAYAESELVDRVSRGLREQREELGLDRDQYLELIAAMVQQIPYGSPAGSNMRSPVRVLLDNEGDCDEKSILAAAILRHEGYGVAVLDFSDQDHVALGVPSSQARFPGTKYALLESTAPAYVGEVAEIISSDGTTQVLDSRPEVIRIAGGKGRSYGAGDEVVYILKRRGEAEEQIAQLEPSAKAASASTPATVEEWKAGNALIARYNRYVDVVNRTSKGVTDRAGTYDWLKARP